VQAPSLPVTVVVDLAAWAAVQACTGYVVHRLPSRTLAVDRSLFKERPCERGGELYVRTLRIKRWKRLLPEAGDVFPGGFDKSKLVTFDAEHLADHLRETRRAELGHWLALAPAPLFFLWNPWPLGLVMQGYALAVNAPCIASQRYNRIRLARVMARRRELDQRKMAER
jgi:glycosyl-4,4'-diaponeurosporenoate acyltransferase